jgi:hypothetical protein
LTLHTDSLLLGIICIVPLYASLVYHCRAWLRLLLVIRCWFSLTGHVLYCFNSASLVLPYWALFVLSHLMIQWFFLNGYGSYCFISCFTGASLLGMACVVSLPSLVSCHPSLVPPYWALIILFHLMIHWYFPTRHGLNCFISYFAGFFLMG